LVDQSVADLAAAVITPPQHHIQRGGDHRDVLDRRHPPSKQLRGRPIDSRRMQLQAALTLAKELGDTLLGDSADT
jgi:hypothetical protein